MQPNRHRRLVIAGLALACAAALSADARGEVLRLENGRTMHGSVDRGFLDEDHLRIQLYTTGGTVKVRWDHLVEADRDRWQIELGLKEDEAEGELMVDGHKVLFTNNDSRYGLVLNPEAMESGGTIQVQVQGKVEEYPRARIAAIEEVRIDLPQVFTAEQAYEQKAGEIQPSSGQGHFDLAEFARAVGAYEQAKSHYEAATEDEDFASTPEGRRIPSLLQRVDVLLANMALREEIADVKRTLIVARTQRGFARAAQMYLDAREGAFALMTKVEDEAVRKEFKLPQLATQVERERRKFFQRYLPSEVYRRVRTLLYDKAKEEKARDFPPGLDRAQMAMLQMQGTFQGARQYATRPITQELWQQLMIDVGAAEAMEAIRELQEENPDDIDPAELERLKRLETMEKRLKQELLDFWTNRSRKGHRTSSYGYGTFIVAESRFKPQRRRGGSNNRGRNARGGNNQQPVDKIKTPDEWWEDANSRERTDWLLAYFAERGGLLEVVRAWDVNCENCAGLGYKKAHNASSGDEEVHRCTTCNGTGIVRKVKWR